MSELVPSRQNEGYEACDDEAEGLFPSGQYFRAASDYELLNSRAVRWKTTCGAAIPHPLRGSPLYTKGPLYRAEVRTVSLGCSGAAMVPRSGVGIALRYVTREI